MGIAPLAVYWQVAMKSLLILRLLALLLFMPYPCFPQGMADFGATHAMSAGLGAGLAASLGNNSKMIKRSYESIAKAQQSALIQTKAIEQYMQLGCQLEAKQKWTDAERSFKYVLQVVSRRDGPGSAKSIPALEHLVSVTKAQNKLNDAIGFQETVVAFKKAATVPNFNEVVKAQNTLSQLLIQNNDYANAEPVLSQAVAQCNAHPTLPQQQRHDTRVLYAQVLRKLHKDAEADSIDAEKVDDQKIEKSSPPIEAIPK